MIRTTIFRLARAAGIALIGMCSCTPEGAPGEADGRLRIVATTSMIADMARIIGGERAHVTGLMGPGIDPHLYKAKEGDVAVLAAADVIFYNGLHLEGKMADVLDKLRSRGMRTVAVAEAIDPARLLSPPGFEGMHDPHVWFDVRLWMRAVERARDAFMEADPPSAGAYRDRAAAYLRELEELDGHVRRRAAEVPEGLRVLVTAHDAFNYFGRAYGFEVRGLQGISTAAEAGAADVRELADFIATRRIPAVFIESSVPVQNIEAVVAACAARGFAVRIGGELFSDALGTAGTPAGTYGGMVKHNIDTIVVSLTGKQ